MAAADSDSSSDSSDSDAETPKPRKMTKKERRKEAEKLYIRNLKTDVKFGEDDSALQLKDRQFHADVFAAPLSDFEEITGLSREDAKRAFARFNGCAVRIEHLPWFDLGMVSHTKIDNMGLHARLNFFAPGKAADSWVAELCELARDYLLTKTMTEVSIAFKVQKLLGTDKIIAVEPIEISLCAQGALATKVKEVKLSSKENNKYPQDRRGDS